MADANSVASRSTFMSQEEQNDRRKRIREIMNDPNLSQQEKSKQVQFLMDGRRRSSATGSVTWSVTSSLQDGDELFWQQPGNQQQYAQYQQQRQQQGQGQQQQQMSNTGHISFSSLVVRADRQQMGMASDEEGDDEMMDDAPDYLYDHNDYRSVASSVSDASDHHLEDHGNAFLLPPGTYRQIHGRSLSLQDWGEDDRRAAVASVAPSLFADHPDQMGRFMEHSRPPCDHYERQCTIISPCCGLPFGCRICHDDCPVLPTPKRRQAIPAQAPMMAAVAAPSPDSGGGGGGGGKMERRHSMPLNLDDNEFDDDQQHHLIDRFAIREIICRKCFTKQSSKA
eukprot:scaffold7763_cov245-Amphora_coffeaeformis.AAC.1